MGVYQQPTDKFECPMCKKLQTKSCPICNEETNTSWKIALSMGKEKK